MGNSLLIMHKVYQNRIGRDVFHLTLMFEIEGQKLSLCSNLADFITKNLELLFFYDTDLFPVVNEKRVGEILDWCSYQAFNNPLSKDYFYPDCFLNNGKVIPDIMLLQDKAIKTFFKNKSNYISINSDQLICHYLFCIILHEKNFGLPDVHSKILNRTLFESNLDEGNIEMVNDFLDLYSDIKSYIGIYSTSLVPSFIAGLDQRKRVVFAFITHVPGV